ncbi:glycosyltransferase family 4 protein [Sphingobium sp. CR28]|uniref:glycosyltransferase family 4 protein n=1 Tax=Sphingobium sp. CR28 TaxID=3400272 RepID=UPI003FED4231
MQDDPRAMPEREEASSASARHREMPIYLRPAWGGANPYTGLFADALVAAGCDVQALRGWPRGRGVVVLHWPDEFFVHHGMKSAAKALLSLARLSVAKKRAGLRIFWVAHNVAPHANGGRSFGLARRWFFRLVDGIMFLSQSSREEVLAAYPALKEKPSVVLAHGVYPSVSAPPALKSSARDEGVHLVLAGLLKRYKAPDLAARLVAAHEEGEVRLTVAGKCDDLGLAQELTEIAGSSDRVDLRFGFLDAADMERLIDEADALLLPYQRILNSGSALMALSRYRPVIAPAIGSLPELRSQVGEGWLWLYDGAFDADKLRAAIAWLRSRCPSGPPNLNDHDWSHIGKRAASFIAS